MLVKWSDFLKANPLNADYDTNASALQSLISINETPENSFRHLADYKSLVCISRNSLDGDIQATFHHTIKRSSFLQTNPDYYGLMGFGTRAAAVKIRHTDLFKHTPKTKVVPEFKSLLKCKTEEEVLALPATNEKISIDFYALLPPCLSEELFSTEDLSPSSVLLLFINKINSMFNEDQAQAPIPPAESNDETDPTSNTTNNDQTPDPEQQEATSGNTASANSTSDNTELTNNDANETTDSNENDDNEGHPASASFSRILNFLCECVKNPRVISDVTITTCTKQSTASWVDHLHTELLGRNPTISTNPATTGINPQTNSLIESMGALTAAMADRQLKDMEAKSNPKSSDATKKFDNLPPITKNTTILCTMVPDMSQEELPEIEPTAAWLSLIGIKSSMTIVRTIEHTMRNRGCIVYLQKGMCNDFRHGTIASSPDPFERNGLCVFLMAPEETKRVKEDRLREIEEKASRNKLNQDDIELLTSNEVYLPKDFWAFEHMVRNFSTITSYLFGNDCLMARAWRIVLEHAGTHQATYKKFERDYQYFYVIVLDELHRRTQTFIHSAADGLLSSLKIRQLDFSSILDAIENHTYFVRRPTGLPKRKQDHNTNPTTPPNNKKP